MARRRWVSSIDGGRQPVGRQVDTERRAPATDDMRCHRRQHYPGQVDSQANWAASPAIANQAPRPGPSTKASVAQASGSRSSQTSESIIRVLRQVRRPVSACSFRVRARGQRRGGHGHDDAGQHHGLRHRVGHAVALGQPDQDEKAPLPIRLKARMRRNRWSINTTPATPSANRGGADQREEQAAVGATPSRDRKRKSPASVSASDSVSPPR